MNLLLVKNKELINASLSYKIKIDHLRFKDLKIKLKFLLFAKVVFFLFYFTFMSSIYEKRSNI